MTRAITQRESLLLAGLALLAACSDATENDRPVGVGGTQATGAAPPAATGGNGAPGAIATGGATTGGVGGVTGRSTTGGHPAEVSGGTPTGGGVPTGGIANGGAAVGGTATGGEPASGGGSQGDPVELCPPGVAQTITVARDGSGQFSTIQSAVDSIPNGSTTATRINISPGTYSEKLNISGRSHLCLVGTDPATTILTWSDSAADGIGTSDSASTVIGADDFSAANLTFENSSPLGDGQAVALRADGQRQQYLGCRFVSYQDTLYNRNGSQYFRDCYVQGNTDYIFGRGTAVFDDCTIHSASEGTAVTAPRTEATVPYGLVFRGGHFTADASVRTGHVHLGRPWGPNGAAAFLEVELDSHIAAAGFTTMGENTLEHARFSEFRNTGPGSNPGARAPEAHQLSDTEASQYTLANIFSGWTPSYSQGPGK